MFLYAWKFSSGLCALLTAVVHFLAHLVGVGPWWPAAPADLQLLQLLSQVFLQDTHGVMEAGGHERLTLVPVHPCLSQLKSIVPSVLPALLSSSPAPNTEAMVLEKLFNQLSQLRPNPHYTSFVCGTHNGSAFLVDVMYPYAPM